MNHPAKPNFDESLAKLETMSPDERRVEFEYANRYLASDEGQREFVVLLKGLVTANHHASKG